MRHINRRFTYLLTDRILIARPRLHFMQRGKNLYFNISITSPDLQTSRLGLGRERLGLDLLRLVPIPVLS